VTNFAVDNNTPLVGVHRLRHNPETQVDCIPLLAFGKVQAAGDRYLLPFFTNFPHALADGLHVARFIKYIEQEAQELAGSFG